MKYVLVALLMLALVGCAAGTDKTTEKIIVADDDTADDTAMDDTEGDDDTGGNISIGDTWTDGGLIWQNPPMGGTLKWDAAVAYCDSLTLDGHNDWHLPSISELRSLIRDCPVTELGGQCGVTDQCLEDTCASNCGLGCYDDPSYPCHWPQQMQGCSQGESPSDWWSSSTIETVPESDGAAWEVDFKGALVVGDAKIVDHYVRCVR